MPRNLCAFTAIPSFLPSATVSLQLLCFFLISLSVAIELEDIGKNNNAVDRLFHLRPVLMVAEYTSKKCDRSKKVILSGGVFGHHVLYPSSPD